MEFTFPQTGVGLPLPLLSGGAQWGGPSKFPQSMKSVFKLFFFLVRVQSGGIQTLYMLSWKPTIPFYGSEFRLVTCPVSLHMWAEDVSGFYFQGCWNHSSPPLRSRQELCRFLLRNLLSLLTKPVYPHLTSSVPPLYMASLTPGPVGQPSFFWLELEISACSQRHLLSGCSRTLSHVCGPGAHRDALSQPAGCCPGSRILSLLSPHNPLRVVSNLQTA